jgi:cbb3-type cytochrome oxidase subunit 1
MSARLIRIAVVYLAIGVTMGIVMGITQQFSLAPVHAHINLLGWASLAIIGVVYRVYPTAGETRLAKIHFWAHNVALPVFMVGLAGMLTGHEQFHVLVDIGATVVCVAIFVFAVNIWRCVRPEPVVASARPAVRAAA